MLFCIIWLPEMEQRLGQRRNLVSTRDMSGISLLYVEDEPDARALVSRMLARSYPKLKIHVAENGADGLDLYRKHAPDIVLTDIHMPVMNGILMSREIKPIDPEAFIIAVTAHSETSFLMNAIEIGINHYLLKPVDYHKLFVVIDKILDQIVLKRLVGEQNRRIDESERQLARAQKIAHLGSWQWHLSSGKMCWSDELFRICGVRPAAIPASYRVFLEKIHPEDREP